MFYILSISPSHYVTFHCTLFFSHCHHQQQSLLVHGSIKAFPNIIHFLSGGDVTPSCSGKGYIFSSFHLVLYQY